MLCCYIKQQKNRGCRSKLPTVGILPIVLVDLKQPPLPIHHVLYISSMKRLSLILIFSFLTFLISAQEIFYIKADFKKHFDAAYLSYPTLPNGILEAVAYTKTHMKHISPNEEEASCIGLPSYYGVMGLTDNSYSYFQSTLELTSDLSGIEIDLIKKDGASNIMAYASSFSKLQEDHS